MNTRNIQMFFVIVLFLIFSPVSIQHASSMPTTIDTSEEFLDNMYSSIAPDYIQMNYYITKYAKQYGVPLNIAYSVAKLETGYKGPDHKNYVPGRTSSADAEGPMQILLSTAREVSGNPELTRLELRHNIELNVKLSMIYLRQLHDICGDWAKTTGFYNTGYFIINDYARTAVK